MRVAIDAVGIRGHGGAAVLLELLHWLPIVRPTWEWTVYVLPRTQREFDLSSSAGNLTVATARFGHSPLGRWRWLAHELPWLLRQMATDVVLCFANIGAFQRYTPQIVMLHQYRLLIPLTQWSQPPWRTLRDMLQRWAVRRGVSCSSAVVVQTQAMKTALGVKWPALLDKVTVIPSGFRTRTGSPSLRPEVVHRLERFASEPCVCFVSHPSEHKNHGALLAAWAQVVRRVPKARLALTLERDHFPNPRYATLVRPLIATAQALGIAKSVEWLGILNPDEVHALLSRSHVLAFPSLAESFGLPLAEALDAGCPIVAADRPYAHDVAGPAARYVDPLRPESIADGIIAVLTDPSLRAELVTAGQQRRHLFAYSTIAEQWATLLAATAHP